MKDKYYALIFTGREDPIWPFLCEICSKEEKERLIHFQTDNPRSSQCWYNPYSNEVNFRIENQVICAQEVKSIWWRRIVPPDLSHFSQELQEYCIKEYQAFLEGLEYLLPHAVWVSRPSAIERARNKAFQLKLAKEIGFQTVDTVFTNSPDIARKFARKLPTVYKSIKSPRVPVYPDRHSTVFTTLLTESHYQEMDGLLSCPGILQGFVKKAADIRVTVFGSKAFSVLIESQQEETSQVDFRVGARHVPHLVHNLPKKEERLCIELTARLGLMFSAIDLALMEDGTYVFFEINPNGQWGWLEEKTGLPMRRALLNLLLHE